jgi:hypothetical protein
MRSACCLQAALQDAGAFDAEYGRLAQIAVAGYSRAGRSRHAMSVQRDLAALMLERGQLDSAHGLLDSASKRYGRRVEAARAQTRRLRV